MILEESKDDESLVGRSVAGDQSRERIDHNETSERRKSSA